MKKEKLIFSPLAPSAMARGYFLAVFVSERKKGSGITAFWGKVTGL
jgi:hypothetical protein